MPGGGPEYAIARALAAAAQVEPDLNTVGVLWVNAVKILLSQHGSGVVYGNHQASAPGQPPAPDTGIYRASWTHKTLGYEVAMYPQMPAGDHPGRLGGWLEFGTSKMSARPHARPTTATMIPVIGQVFAKGIEGRERSAG